MASFDAFDGDDLNPETRHFDDQDDVVVVDSFSGYDSYSAFPADQPNSADEYVAVDHSASPDDFFQDSNPDYSKSSPFGSVPVVNGNGNGYGGYGSADGDIAGVFSSDGPMLPPPGEMEAEEGFALREWRR